MRMQTKVLLLTNCAKSEKKLHYSKKTHNKTRVLEVQSNFALIYRIFSAKPA